MPSQPPTPRPESSASGEPGADLPDCEAVRAAIGSIAGDLEFDPSSGEAGADGEGIEQRSCLYSSGAGAVTIQVTVSRIAFREEELEAYRSLPTVIDDERARQSGAVLQTVRAEGGPDDHLGSTMFLFDRVYSIAIESGSVAEPTSVTLPALTVGAAADAAFAIRALLPAGPG